MRLPIIAVLIACGAHAAAPDWVASGGGAAQRGDNRLFYGVGVGSKQEAADSDSREKLDKSVLDFVAFLHKGYLISRPDGAQKAAPPTASLEARLKRVPIADRWIDPADGSAFARCKYDLQAVKDWIFGAKGLKKDFRDWALANIEASFDAMRSAQEN